MSRLEREFMCYIIHKWCVVCVQEILRDSEAMHNSRPLLFMPHCSSQQVGETAMLGRRRQRGRLALSSSSARGFFTAGVASSDRFFIKPTPSSDVRALISPEPLLTPLTCAQTQEFSVMTSLTASGCVFQVCSPGLDVLKRREQ